MKLIFNPLPRRLPLKCIAGAFSHVSNRKTCWIVRVLWDLVVSYGDIKWWKSTFCVYETFEPLTVLPFENICGLRAGLFGLTDKRTRIRKKLLPNFNCQNSGLREHERWLLWINREQMQQSFSPAWTIRIPFHWASAIPLIYSTVVYGNNPTVPYQYNGRPVPRTLPVKLKGVDLPKFSGEDKADYEPWNAAFISIVDLMDIPVGEKVLWLQSSLTGKALALVKDLGYSPNALRRLQM